MQDRWTRVYEEYSDDSGFEHVNPSVIMSAHIEEDSDGISVILTNIHNNQRVFAFDSAKAAQRFIKRLGHIA